MSKILYEQISLGKRPKMLQLIVDDVNTAADIQDLEEEYKEFLADPSNEGIINSYVYSEYGEQKTSEKVLKEMKADITALRSMSQGLVPMTPEEEATYKIMAEIYGVKKMEWTPFFDKVQRKADGTFAIGRVVKIYQCSGFSWEDEESHGRKGYELIIKTYSDTEARLEIRIGMVEKW
jgi:hypothetical protein